MAKGVPVLSSSHACAKEILQDSALYFDPRDVDDIVRAITTILSDKNLRDDLIERGYGQIRKYNWKRMAQDTLAIYNRI